MMGLVPFVKGCGVEFDAGDRQCKIHLACWTGTERPIDVYYDGRWKEWQEGQNQRNFTCPFVISLIDIGQSHWLFVGVYSVHGCRPNPIREGAFIYSTILLPGQDELIGRIIVHHKRSRASYIWSTAEVQLPIVEVRPEKLTIADFPGYNSILLSHAQLQTITRQQIASWHGALSSIKGVYLIVDSSTGRAYVGKASGTDGIWSRWCAYADNGHGGNVQLKALLQAEGREHMRHFQYSILEIADTHASDEDILVRESHWMQVLRSREFGLNGSAWSAWHDPTP